MESYRRRAPHQLGLGMLFVVGQGMLQGYIVRDESFGGLQEEWLAGCGHGGCEPSIPEM